MTNQKQKNRVTILDVPFDVMKEKEVLQMLLQQINAQNHKPLLVTTPNPEMLLEGQKNESFRKILQQSDLNIPDGIGIIFAARLLGNPLKERVTGTDLMQKLCRNFSHANKVFLLGAAEGVAEEAKSALEAKNPHLNIVGTYSGSPSQNEEAHIQQIINKSGANVLFVAYGAPKQEEWLHRNLSYLSTIKLAMGVGGAFDFIAGVRKRAPHWMQKLGLEWLFRLIHEPRRIKRIFNATIRFPIVFFISILRGKHKKAS